MKPIEYAALCLLLTACGPEAPPVDHRGEAGQYCKPDGTCISERLECVNSPVFLGLPMDATPTCKVREKR